MDNFNIWCLIIPLITAVLGWVLRHLTCKKCDYSELEAEIEALKNKNAKLKADLEVELDELRAKNRNLKSELEICVSKRREVEEELNICLASKLNLEANASSNLGISGEINTEIEPELIFDAAAAKLALGKKIVADDLKIIEGIGPKIAQLFNDNGISTWYQLSKASVERCQQILDIGGKRYEIHNPATWPKQSALAFEGKWKELNELQDYLDGGVDRG